MRACPTSGTRVHVFAGDVCTWCGAPAVCKHDGPIADDGTDSGRAECEACGARVSPGADGTWQAVTADDVLAAALEWLSRAEDDEWRVTVALIEDLYDQVKAANAPKRVAVAVAVVEWGDGDSPEVFVEVDEAAARRRAAFRLAFGGFVPLDDERWFIDHPLAAAPELVLDAEQVTDAQITEWLDLMREALTSPWVTVTGDDFETGPTS